MHEEPARRHDVVVVGGGAAGLAACASLLARRPGLDIAVIEPKAVHDYQPGWTLVGAGVFDTAVTRRPMSRCIPKAARWIQEEVSAFAPQADQVRLANGEV